MSLGMGRPSSRAPAASLCPIHRRRQASLLGLDAYRKRLPSPREDRGSDPQARARAVPSSIAGAAIPRPGVLLYFGTI